MDQLVLFFTILAILEIETQYRSRNNLSYIFSGLWIGILASIKQTGILIAIIMVFYGLYIGFIDFKSNNNLDKMKQMIHAPQDRLIFFKNLCYLFQIIKQGDKP